MVAEVYVFVLGSIEIIVILLDEAIAIVSSITVSGKNHRLKENSYALPKWAVPRLSPLLARAWTGLFALNLLPQAVGSICLCIMFLKSNFTYFLSFSCYLDTLVAGTCQFLSLCA